MWSSSFMKYFSFLFIPLILFAGEGYLDTSFDNDGKVTTSIGTTDEAYSVAIQPDGKIVVVGYSSNGSDLDFAVVRYNTDGSLDTGFDSDGKVITDINSGSSDYARSVAIQSDGKIIVVGRTNADIVVVRYNTDGSLDSDFGTNGKVTTDIGGSNDYAYSVIIQNDGKIVVAGEAYMGASKNDFCIVRYNSNGTLDTAFDTDGKVTVDIANGKEDYGRSLAIQSDGKIVVGGYYVSGSDYYFTVIRLDTDGSLDTSFDGDGIVTTLLSNNATNRLESILVQSDGKIVTGGSAGIGSSFDYALVRYNSNGSLDTNFDSDGKLTIEVGTANDFCHNIAIQNDGKIIAVGESLVSTDHDFSAVRINDNGTLDTSFDYDGKVTTAFGSATDEAHAAAIQTDGKIVIAGFSNNGSNNDFAVARYIGDATAPTNPTGLVTTPGNQQVALSWTANTESDLAKYRVYRSTTSGFTPSASNKIAEPTSNSYTDTGLTNGTTYYYKISAVDNAGNESGYSNEVSATPLFRVTSFVPNSGIAGTGVTIYGVGFSTTASNNAVKFGNVSATVSSSTSSILKVSVPSGILGPVSVSVSTGGVTDTSATLFTVIPVRTDMTVFGSQHVITTLADDAQSVYSADLDGDGDLDVLSASFDDDKIAWYENTDGSGTFGSQQVITTLADGAKSVHSADLDGDGDLDVLSASYGDNKIAWYENTDGMGTFGSQQVITTLAYDAQSVYSADLDGDGDLDVLSASWIDDKIAWYENTDGMGTFGSQQVITTLANYATSVHSADLDGDGDMDVLSASANDDKIAWYENTDGMGTFSSQQVITTLADGAYSVYSADLDGDGDLDVLSASTAYANIAWYENTDGMGTFGSQQVITTLVNYPASVYSADLDGDGDLDVLSASWNDDKIAWYENTDGSGTFGSQQVINTLADGARSVHSADLDGDGDLDVLSASWIDDKIAWYENTEAPPAAPANFTATPGNGQVSLSWTANSESDLAKYKVYRSTTSGFTPSASNKIAEPTTNSYTDTGLTNGTTYYYKISAADNAGNESGYSGEVSVTPVGTVAHWNFNEMSGSILTDISGNGNSGTISGASWASGYSGGALYFDALSDEVVVPHSESINLGSSSFTIEAIIKTDGTAIDLSNPAMTIVGKYTIGNIGYQIKVIANEHVDVNSRGKINVYINENSPTGRVEFTGNQNIADDRWHHVVFIRDTVSVLYVDGLIDSAVSSQLFCNTNNTQNLKIGHYPVSGIGQSNWTFHGSIDEIRISNRALSIEEFLPFDTTPAAPTNTTATPGNTQVTLKWSKNTDSDFAKYIIYGGISANPTTKVDSTTSADDTTKTITGLTNGTTYYYRITAVDNAGNESAYSSEVHVTPTIVPSGLVAYYNFSGDAKDGSGNGNDGTVNGAILTTDRFGNTSGAYSFDGINNYVSISDNNSLDITESFTIGIWIKPDAIKDCFLVSKHTPFINNDGSWGFLMQNSGKLQFVFNFGGADSYSQGYIQPDIWTFVIFTYDDQTNTCKFYFDGVLDNTSSAISNIQNTDKLLYIGSDGGSYGFFDGIIDESRIYNRALTEAEIQTLYNEGGWDVTPPVFSSGYPSTANIGGTSLDLKIKINEGGKAYYVLLSDGATAPTSAEVKAGTGSGGATVVKSGNLTLVADTESTVNITDLTSETAYDIYVVAEDDYSTPNLQSSPTKIDVTTSDITAPTVATLSPEDGQTNVSINTNLVISFSEAVTIGTGNVTLKKVSDNTDVEVIDVTGTKVSVSGVVVTVNPENDFDSNTEYYVLIDATAFDDLAGNDFAGISDKTTWNFTTLTTADTEVPSAISAVVNDGFGEDLDYQNSLTTIEANWSGFTDNTGVISYDWAIGTTSGGTDVQDWTGVGNVTSVSNSSLTLSEGGTYYVSVMAKDAAGYASDPSISDGVTVDATSPTIIISSTVSPATNVSPVPIDVSFSESVTGFEGSDITVGTGTLSNFSGSGTTYSFDLTPSGEDTVTVDITANSALDVASNGNAAATQFTIIYDITPPTAGTVNDGSGADIGSQVSTTTIEANWSGFSDSLTGIVSYEWTIGSTSGGTDIQTWTEAGITTNASNSTLSLTDGVTYFVSVRAEDGAGNVSPVVTSDGVTVNVSAITTSISSSILFATNTSSIPVTITFSDAVTGFEVSDVTVGNGTLSNFSGSGTTYTFDVTPDGEGTITVDIGENVVQDQAGNINAAATQFAIIYDTTDPIVGTVNDGSEADIDFQASTTTIEANWRGFSDEGSGIASFEWAIGSNINSTDVMDWTDVGLDTLSMITSLNLIDGTTYYVFVRAKDEAGNQSQEAFSDGVTVSVAAPSVSISSTQSSPTNVSFISIEVTFSEPVTGFEQNDISVGNGYVAIGTFSGSDSTYTFTVIPFGSGTVTVDVGEQVAQDDAGNNNTAAIQFSIVYDGTAPIVGTVIDGTTEDLDWTGDDSTFTASWSGFTDELSGIEQYEYAIGTTQGGTEIVDWTSTETDTSVTKTDLSLVNSTTYYISVRATDGAGNISSAATTDGITIDTNAPVTGIVQDGLSGDLDWTNSATSLSANWSDFSDDLTGIASYEYAIGTEPVGIDLVDWTSVGLDTSFIRVDLSLTSGITYYISVRASDRVDNTSNGVSSDGVTVDYTPPTVVTPWEGSESDDLDWQQSTTTLNIYWSGSDEGGEIDFYEYSVGTTPGDSNIVFWTNNGTDTSATVGNLNLEEGIVYYANIKAYDMASNVSEVASSDGIQIDITAPTGGSVNDGLTGDINFSDSPDSVSSNWSGFEDAQSGISHYEVAVGTTPSGIDVTDFTDAGSGNTSTITGLALEHGSLYYCSVRAVDLVDNVSETVSSDGFTIDLYPGPPYVIQTTPDSGSYLSPIRSSEIAIKFSEPISYYDLGLQSALDFDIQFGASHSSDSIVIMLESPLVSLDTIQISLSNVTDFGGLVADETIYTYYTDLLGDYTSDLKIDLNDLSIFVEGWTNKDYTVELGPITGDVPHLIPYVDGVYDIWDVASFTRMWHWSHGNTTDLILVREPVGELLKVVQGAVAVAVTLPEEASAGQFIFQYSIGSVDVSVTAQEPSEERIFLNLKDAEIGQLLVEFGYLTNAKEKQVLFDVQSLSRENSTASLVYTLFGDSGEILSQGVRSIELIAIPEKFTLHQNYPNPFNPATTILYDLPSDARVTLVIYDILGRQVRTLIKEERPAGYHSVIWNSKDEVGVNVSAGVYIYRIQARNIEGDLHVKAHKMLLLK